MKNLEKTMLTGILVLFLATISYAQKLADVGEDCSSAKCKSGLYCVKLRNGDTVCSECTQSQLDSYTSKVDDYCKEGALISMKALRKAGYGEGTFNAMNEPKLKEALDNAKRCLKAREDRENACWNGGDKGHKEQIQDVKNGINELDKAINDRRGAKLLYNCDPSRYESNVKEYQRKCEFLKSANDVLDKMEDEAAKTVDTEGAKMDCRKVEDFNKKCKECEEALDDLIDDCFKGSESNIFTKAANDFKQVKKLQEQSKKLLDDLKSDKLCK